MLTVFTPTYNRAYIMGKLYESLCAQTCKDFEWVIVDDGSKDNTRELIDGFIAEKKINIRYFYQENAGKHIAINHGVKEALGELFFIVDSDDYLTQDAVEWILKEAHTLMNDNAFAGLSGTRIKKDGSRIGGETAFTSLDCTALEIRLKYHLTGDLAEVYKTSILKQFSFPAFNEEKFCPEALVWNRIAQKYKLRYVNKGIYVCEYLSDGLTAKITRLRHASPYLSMLYYYEYATTHISSVSSAQKIKGWINFWRFAESRYLSEFNNLSLLSLLCYLPGKLMLLNDKKG